MTITLSADTPYPTWIIKWDQHSNRAIFKYMADTLNRVFGEIVLEGAELRNKIFEAGDKKALKDDAITAIRTWYAKGIYDNVSAIVTAGNNADDIKAKINRVPILAVTDGTNKRRLRTSTQLANCIKTYIIRRVASNESAEFTEEGALVLHFDTSVSI